MKEREREIISSLSLSALWVLQDLLSVIQYCYACWVECKHMHSLILFRAEASQLRCYVYRGFKNAFCEKTFLFKFTCKQRVELFYTFSMLLVSCWLCWNPHCYKPSRHIKSYQDQVFFTFSRGFSLPCVVSARAYWHTRAQFDPDWNSSWQLWATVAQERRESEQKTKKYLE